MARNENMIAALKRERAGYVAHGETDRVRQVDEQLARYGYEPETVDEQAGPRGRTAPPGQTSDASSGQGAAKKTTAVKKAAAPPQK